MTHASDAPARLRAHQRHHLDSGFADLAYHFIVDVAGNVYEGRPLTAPGETFTDYDPAGHFLATAEGNFDEQQPTPAQLGALTDLLAWGCVTYDLDPFAIEGHHDVAATSCPGAALRALVDDGTVATAVSDVIASGGVELVVLGVDEGRARVAAIEAGG